MWVCSSVSYSIAPSNYGCGAPWDIFSSIQILMSSGTVEWVECSAAQGKGHIPVVRKISFSGYTYKPISQVSNLNRFRSLDPNPRQERFGLVQFVFTRDFTYEPVDFQPAFNVLSPNSVWIESLGIQVVLNLARLQRSLFYKHEWILVVQHLCANERSPNHANYSLRPGQTFLRTRLTCGRPQLYVTV